MKYYCISKKGKKAEDVREKIIDLLSNHTVDKDNPDVVFSIGGDGTYLRAVREYIDILDKTLFISINIGHLGFYSNLNIKSIDNIEKILMGDYNVWYHDLIQFKINNDKVRYAINEVAIYATPNLGKFKVCVDDEFLEDFSGNGLCISTPTGSTGLNKSLMGGIIDEKLHTMQMTEIAGIQSNAYHSINNAIIFSNERKISIYDKEKTTKVIAFDNEKIVVGKLDRVIIEYSKMKVRNLKYSQKDFFERVQKSFLK